MATYVNSVIVGAHGASLAQPAKLRLEVGAEFLLVIQRGLWGKRLPLVITMWSAWPHLTQHLQVKLRGQQGPFKVYICLQTKTFNYKCLLPIVFNRCSPEMRRFGYQSPQLSSRLGPMLVSLAGRTQSHPSMLPWGQHHPNITLPEYDKLNAWKWLWIIMMMYELTTILTSQDNHTTTSAWWCENGIAIVVGGCYLINT